MELHFTFSAAMPKYETIYRQLKQYIVSQQLCAHEKLPTKRRLAAQLHLSVHTVQLAYEQLISEGYSALVTSCLHFQQNGKRLCRQAT